MPSPSEKAESAMPRFLYIAPRFYPRGWNSFRVFVLVADFSPFRLSIACVYTQPNNTCSNQLCEERWMRRAVASALMVPVQRRAGGQVQKVHTVCM